MLSFIRIIPGRIAFSLLLLAGIYSFANYIIIKWIVTPDHLLIEHKLAQREVERFVDALSRETEVLATTAHDWAAWDDTYAFVHDQNPQYIESNLSNTTLIDNKFNLLAIFRLDGLLVWSQAIDLETKELIILKELLPDELKPNLSMLHHTEVNSSIAGLKKTVRGPMLFASRPIVTSENQGPIVGTLIFGRLLNEPFLSKLREQTKVSSRLISLDNQKAIAGIPVDISTLHPANPFVFHYAADTLTVYSLLVDYQGHGEWLLEVHADRLLTSDTREIFRYVLISNCLIGFVTLVLFFGLYKKQLRKVSATFRRLIDQSLPENIKERRKNPTLRSFSTDEFSRLSNDLRAMIASFEETKVQQKNIITQCETSRNALNTMLVREVKTRLKIEENLQKIQVDLEKQVDRRTKELQQTNVALRGEIEVRIKNESELKKNRQRLRALSSELMEMEDKERRQLATDLHDQIGQSLSVVKMYVDAAIFSSSDDNSRENLLHIAAIVDQTVQDVRTLTFELSPPVLYELGLDAALEWLAEEFQKKYSLLITIECEGIPKSVTSAFLALIFRTIRELLINIVRHAKADSAGVTVCCVDKNVRLIVSDNGIGMEKGEDSSGESSNGGFGLFSIRERILNIGGSFDIDSEKNKGTKITLIMPIQDDCIIKSR